MKNFVLLFCFALGLTILPQARKGPYIQGTPYPIPQGPTLPQPHQPIPRK